MAVKLFVPSPKVTVTKELASAVPVTWIAAFSEILMDSLPAIWVIIGGAGAVVSTLILLAVTIVVPGIVKSVSEFDAASAVLCAVIADTLSPVLSCPLPVEPTT